CYYCFFFQAEDGIRDGHVTGVQTCALPIFRRFWIARSLHAKKILKGKQRATNVGIKLSRSVERTCQQNGANSLPVSKPHCKHSAKRTLPTVLCPLRPNSSLRLPSRT